MAYTGSGTSGDPYVVDTYTSLRDRLEQDTQQDIYITFPKNIVINVAEEYPEEAPTIYVGDHRSVNIEGNGAAIRNITMTSGVSRSQDNAVFHNRNNQSTVPGFSMSNIKFEGLRVDRALINVSGYSGGYKHSLYKVQVAGIFDNNTVVVFAAMDEGEQPSISRCSFNLKTNTFRDKFMPFNHNGSLSFMYNVVKIEHNGKFDMIGLGGGNNYLGSVRKTTRIIGNTFLLTEGCSSDDMFPPDATGYGRICAVIYDNVIRGKNSQLIGINDRTADNGGMHLGMNVIDADNVTGVDTSSVYWAKCTTEQIKSAEYLNSIGFIVKQTADYNGGDIYGRAL